VCEIVLEKTDKRGKYVLTCEDNDPEGFPNLAYAYTAFAPSLKKSDPGKAGRFCMGEKFVLSFCDEARIETTKGTVVFNDDGRHEYPRRKREAGTKFWAVIDCNEERLGQFVAHMQHILVKPGLTLTVNGLAVPSREPIAVFQETLATELGDELRSTRRKCAVELYEVGEGETAMLCELGIAVVETGDKWHYSVGQKVPLNVDRDNVTPAYLRDLRTYVFNHMHGQVAPEDMEDAWVEQATSDDKVTDEAIADFKRKKYGEHAVAEDPFNRDANAAALVAGRTVIPGHGLTKGQRENMKNRGLLASSSQAFPTAGKGVYSNDPDAEPVDVITQSDWTDGMREIHEYTQGVAQRLIGRRLDIEFVRWPAREGGYWQACYGTGHLLGRPFFHYNVGTLGRKWFANGVTEDTDSIIIHELGHEFCRNHADENYFRALTKLGARLKAAALAEPEWFRRFLHQDRPHDAGKTVPVAELGEVKS
jgi:hypothetical protein